MLEFRALLLIFPVAVLAQDATIDRSRLASQAQSFAEQLPNLICTEQTNVYSPQFCGLCKEL